MITFHMSLFFIKQTFFVESVQIDAEMYSSVFLSKKVLVIFSFGD